MSLRIALDLADLSSMIIIMALLLVGTRRLKAGHALALIASLLGAGHRTA